MIDLHTHTLLSDGDVLPSEMVRQAEVIGYRAIGLTDHVDVSNIDFVLPRTVKVCKVLNAHWKIVAIPGVEISYVPPREIASLVKYARKNGARVIVIHGETVADFEPVPPGTNAAGIEAGADIIAHPGRISDKEALLATKRGVLLELSTRKAHASGNAHVARAAQRAGCGLILNSDAHSFADLLTEAARLRILQNLGLSRRSIEGICEAPRKFLTKRR